MTLARLRVRLTLWYAATFVLILLVLGTGIFVAIGVQVSRRLDISLAAATAAITHATSDWEAERAAGQTADAVEELRIPDRDLYLFDADKGKSSTCYGGCAKAWPPFLTKGKPSAGPGVNARLLGTTKRRDGSLQVTYAGHPLYYYEGDKVGKASGL